MVIKDEVHVAHLLTSPRKLERDRLTYDIDPSRGDKISYRHFTTPQFTLFGKDFRFKIITYNWMLSAMKRLKFLRGLMPGWHKPQKEFIDWYIGNVVERFIGRQGDYPSYRAFCEALNTPESAKGYREVRYPGMLAARRAVALLLGENKERSQRAAESGKAGSRPAFQWRNFEKPEKIEEIAGKK
jgi:indolepyruvate ferredoxin oxidoreductase